MSTSTHLFRQQIHLSKLVNDVCIMDHTKMFIQVPSVEVQQCLLALAGFERLRWPGTFWNRIDTIFLEHACCRPGRRLTLQDGFDRLKTQLLFVLGLPGGHCSVCCTAISRSGCLTDACCSTFSNTTNPPSSTGHTTVAVCETPGTPSECTAVSTDALSRTASFISPFTAGVEVLLWLSLSGRSELPVCCVTNSPTDLPEDVCCATNHVRHRWG